MSWKSIQEFLIEEKLMLQRPSRVFHNSFLRPCEVTWNRIGNTPLLHEDWKWSGFHTLALLLVWKRLFFIQFHWQFWTTSSCFWLVNILLRKFDTSSKNDMKLNKTQIVCCKTTEKCQKRIWFSKIIYFILNLVAPLTCDVTYSKL